jgi:hypothetical protein
VNEPLAVLELIMRRRRNPDLGDRYGRLRARNDGFDPNLSETDLDDLSRVQPPSPGRFDPGVARVGEEGLDWERQRPLGPGWQRPRRSVASMAERAGW